MKPDILDSQLVRALRERMPRHIAMTVDVVTHSVMRNQITRDRVRAALKAMEANGEMERRNRAVWVRP